MQNCVSEISTPQKLTLKIEILAKNGILQLKQLSKNFCPKSEIFAKFENLDNPFYHILDS